MRISYQEQKHPIQHAEGICMDTLKSAVKPAPEIIKLSVFQMAAVC